MCCRPASSRARHTRPGRPSAVSRSPGAAPGRVPGAERARMDHKHAFDPGTEFRSPSADCELRLRYIGELGRAVQNAARRPAQRLPRHVPHRHRHQVPAQGERRGQGRITGPGGSGEEAGGHVYVAVDLRGVGRESPAGRGGFERRYKVRTGGGADGRIARECPEGQAAGGLLRHATTGGARDVRPRRGPERSCGGSPQGASKAPRSGACPL